MIAELVLIVIYSLFSQLVLSLSLSSYLRLINFLAPFLITMSPFSLAFANRKQQLFKLFTANVM